MSLNYLKIIKYKKGEIIQDKQNLGKEIQSFEDKLALIEE